MFLFLFQSSLSVVDVAFCSKGRCHHRLRCVVLCAPLLLLCAQVAPHSSLRFHHTMHGDAPALRQTDAVSRRLLPPPTLPPFSPAFFVEFHPVGLRSARTRCT